MKTTSLHFQQNIKSYDLIIGENLLHGNEIVQLCKRRNNTIAIITDDFVKKLYGDNLQRHLSDHGLKVFLYTFPHGEQSKTRETKESLEDQMLQDGLGRDTTVLALGGGVVTDLAGFIASTYCRGIPLILCPTSLLAMVDASIGAQVCRDGIVKSFDVTFSWDDIFCVLIIFIGDS